MTWDEMVRLEPALLELEADIRRLRPRGKRFDVNSWWYGYGGHPGFRRRLLGLVGLSARNPALRSERDYGTAYSYLYGLLPACRGCG